MKYFVVALLPVRALIGLFFAFVLFLVGLLLAVVVAVVHPQAIHEVPELFVELVKELFKWVVQSS